MRVDVIYRRIDDLFLDPEVFRPDSTLGVPGLMRAWRAGNVALANAPGAGVADDKVVYAYVPEIIRYYLDEEPLLPNVPTLRCASTTTSASYVLEQPRRARGEAGQRVGRLRHADRHRGDRRPSATSSRPRIAADPRNYIAQPIVEALDRADARATARVEPRHLDLRPFILPGRDPYVHHGGLTRVALREGSLVVNRSQGGGSKDTWIVDLDRPHRAMHCHRRREVRMLLSRVAESVYWAGRYLERAEVDGPPREGAHRAVTRPPASAGIGWSPLLAVTGSGRSSQAPAPDASKDQRRGFLAADPDKAGSVATSIAEAHGNLRQTPPRSSHRESWEVLNQLHHWTAKHDIPGSAAAAAPASSSASASCCPVCSREP